MALERANPLPPNQHYWVDVSPEDAPAFDSWLQLNSAAVKVISTSRDASSGWQWVLFDVQAPLVFWAGPGYPTIADPSIKTETDAKQIPTAGDSTLLRDAALLAGAGLLGLFLIRRLLP